MPPRRVLALTALTMTAFAGNSLLCRRALDTTAIDAVSFTTLRLVSGAVVLSLLARASGGDSARHGDWISAAALFGYAAGFSLAYVALPASVGALLLFGAVQATMIGHGLARGERLRAVQVLGLALAFGGLGGLLIPGLSAPPLRGAVLMTGAGIAWGVYSLRGRGTKNPLSATAGNFVRTIPMTLVLGLVLRSNASIDGPGAIYAIVSGAIASGLGYAVWYTVLPALRATTAATVQLSVPVIAALGGLALLGEAFTLRLLLCSIAILGGIAVFILEKRAPR